MRVYCPTDTVRDITGKWKKARKAYVGRQTKDMIIEES